MRDMSTSGHSGSSFDTGEVVGTVDDDGVNSEYVIADITADDAWLSMQTDDAPTLPDWR